MSRYGNSLNTYEINSEELKELLDIAKTLKCTPETEQALIKMAKELWRSGANYYISDYEMACMLTAGLEGTPFSYNHVFTMDANVRQGPLKYRLFPLMIKAGMLTKDTSGRFDRHTVTETGFNWLLNSMFTDCECGLSGECKQCKTGTYHKNRKGDCWNCDGDKVCSSCKRRFEFFGYERFINLVQTYNHS